MTITEKVNFFSVDSLVPPKLGILVQQGNMNVLCEWKLWVIPIVRHTQLLPLENTFGGGGVGSDDHSPTAQARG